MSTFKDINDRLITLEVATRKDLNKIINDVAEIKSTTKDTNSALENIKMLLDRRAGAIAFFKTSVPLILAVLGAFMTLVIFVGYGQRIEREKEISSYVTAVDKRVLEIERRITKRPSHDE